MRQVFLAALTVFAAATSSPAKADIGVLAAVNRDMTGARPTEAPRPVFINEKLVENERIATTADGGGQVLFLDQTSLTIAPNSNVVLDKYVFDPNSQTGEIGVTIARGALRLIGGRVTKTGEATVRTPSATIGIRGGIGSTTVMEDGSTRYIHMAGFSSRIQTPLGELVITREGGYAIITPGGEIGFQGVATPEVMAAALQSSAGRGGGGSIGGGDVGARIGTVESIVSGADGAVENGPISTVGERQTVEYQPSSDGFTEPPRDDITDANLDTNEPAPTQPPIVEPFLDGVFFAGVYNATASTGGAPLTAEVPIQVFYSISAGEGFAVAGVPVVDEPLFPVSQTPGGDNFVPDQFIVVGQGDNLITDPALPNTLFGGISTSQFTRAGDNTLSGQVAIDYQTAAPLLQSVSDVSGSVANLPGVDAPGNDIRLATQDLRSVLANPLPPL